jgi:hypothetical protein
LAIRHLAAVGVREQRTIQAGSSTDAESIRADSLTAAYDKQAPRPQLVKLWVCQWEKRLVQEFLLPGNVDAVGLSKDWTVEKLVGRFKADC